MSWFKNMFGWMGRSGGKSAKRGRSRQLNRERDFRINDPESRSDLDFISQRAAQASKREYWLKRIRAFDIADGVVPGILNLFENQIIGTGLIPTPLTGDKALDKKIRELWLQWSDSRECEITQRFTELEAQQLMLRSWLRDGEVFILHQRGGRLDIPYQYKILESDTVPFSDGIEYTLKGAPMYYKVVHKEGQAPVRIRANKIEHLASWKRVGDERGTSIIVPVLQHIEDINIIDAAMREGTMINSALVMAIRRELPTAGQAMAGGVGEFGDSGDTGAEIDLKIGTIVDNLAPGESLEALSTQRPSFNEMEYRKVIVKQISATVDCSYSTVARDYTGTYSAQRQEKVEVQVPYKKYFSIFVSRAMKPRYRKFLEALKMKEIVPDATPDTVIFHKPSENWIDPLNEVKADMLALQNKTMSRQQIIEKYGLDYEETLAMIEQDPYKDELNPQQQGGKQDGVTGGKGTAN